MKRLIEFPLDQSGVLIVETDIDADDGLVPAGLGSDAITAVQQRFEDALSKVKPAAAAVIATIRDLSDLPDQVQVEFGIKLSAKAGAVLAAVATEANYKVTLTWKNEKIHPKNS